MDANLDPALHPDSLHGLEFDPALEHGHDHDHHDKDSTQLEHEADLMQLGAYDPNHHQGPDLQVYDGEGVGIDTVQGVLQQLAHHPVQFADDYPLDAHLPALSPALDAPQFTPSEEPKEKPEGGNKKHWSKDEDETLLKLVDKDGPRNWASIAAGLQTGRSGPSCCARWCRLAGPKAGDAKDTDGPEDPTLASNVVAYKAIKKGKRTKWAKWTQDEDQLLRSLVEEHGAKNWGFISGNMKTDRSDDSCCGRWTHYLAPKMVAGINPDGESTMIPAPKSNSNAANPRWTPREDKKLRVIKLSNPDASWASIGENMKPARSAGSCRARWVQHIVGKVVVPEEEEEEAGEDDQEEEGGEEEATETAPAEPTASTSTLPADAVATGASASGPEPDLVVGPSNLAALASILDPALRDLASGEPAPTPAAPVSKKSMAKGKGRAPSRNSSWNGKGTDSNPGGAEGEAEEPTSAQLAALKKDLGEDVFEELSVPGHMFKPSIQHPWTQEEETHLLELVKELGRKGWSKIAETLGTNRTAASVSARWQRLTSLGITTTQPNYPDDIEPTPTRLKGKVRAAVRGNKGNWTAWTTEDDAELRVLIAQYGKNNWVQVGRELTRPRSGYAVSSRWYEHITKGVVPSPSSGDKDAEVGLIHLDLPATEDNDNDNAEKDPDAPPPPPPVASVSKRRWTPAEDLELRRWYAEFGEKFTNDGARWTAISKKMTTERPASSCRLRWLNYLCRLPEPTVDIAHLNNSIGIDLAASLADDSSAASLKFLGELSAAAAQGPLPPPAGPAIVDGMDIDVGEPVAGSSGEKHGLFSEEVVGSDEEAEEGHVSKRSRRA
ncbi:hypothetical protein RQP46_009051 [Phenoliferia psychrophenolica]